MIVFCSAPYRADTDDGIAENVRRANAFSAYAVTRGFAPINLMPAILAGAYGPLDSDELMEAGVCIALEIVRMVSTANGELWVLRRPDCSFSSGCSREILEFNSVLGTGKTRFFDYDVATGGFVKICMGDTE